MKLEKQVSAGHYDFCKYVDKGRWMSFYYQILEIMSKNPQKVLEVGAGKRVVGAILEQNGIDYETVDIDPELKPDHLASVLEMPLRDNSYDVVCCFQMLEHIPYEDFPKALKEIRRVARNYAVISLPDAKTLFHYSFHIPKVGIKHFSIPKPLFKPPIHIFDGEHRWEINKAGYLLNRVISDIKAAGFKIETTYRPIENSYHRFFVLKC